MSLPTQYLTSQKNLKRIFEAIQAAQAPKRFTTSFLEGIGFKSTADRLVIGVLKAIGFLTANGEPTSRYFQYLDQTQSKAVLADGIREAYADLFQVNSKANELSLAEVKNKLRTLTRGQYSDAVINKMAATFKSIAGLADFSAESPSKPAAEEAAEAKNDVTPPAAAKRSERPAASLGGLVYNIQIHLPESRDPAVYDALFRSLREHLL